MLQPQQDVWRKKRGNWLEMCRFEERMSTRQPRPTGIFRMEAAEKLDTGAGLIQVATMIQTIDALAQGAIELPPDQRFALAQRILASVEPEEATRIDDAWTEEIRERILKFDSGETKGIPGAEVFAEVDRRLAL